MFLIPPIYIGGIFIFLYKSYRTRVPDIRKYVNEQTTIESKGKKRETSMRMREQERGEKSVFWGKEGNAFSERPL